MIELYLTTAGGSIAASTLRVKNACQELLFLSLSESVNQRIHILLGAANEAIAAGAYTMTIDTYDAYYVALGNDMISGNRIEYRFSICAKNNEDGIIDITEALVITDADANVIRHQGQSAMTKAANNRIKAMGIVDENGYVKKDIRDKYDLKYRLPTVKWPVPFDSM